MLFRSPLVFAGAVAQQILQEQYGIKIGARIASLHTISDSDCPDKRQLLTLKDKPFPVVDDSVGQAMQQCILQAKENGNSVGGVIECAAFDVPAGLGEPFFDSVESKVAHMLFSIPAVKGISFGDGFALAAMTGLEANDQMTMENGQVKLLSNHNGGINGGITNGEALILSVAVKPTPTISIPQQTVNIQTGRALSTASKGRHDPCILQRALPVVEGCLAFCLLDFLSACTMDFHK